MPNVAYPNQYIDIKNPHGSGNHVIIPGIVKIPFNLDIESTDKSCSVVNNVARALVGALLLDSKEINTINNSDIYDTYKDLYLSKKEHEERLLQGIQSANGLKARLDATNGDGTALTVTIQENAIKKTFGKTFAVPLDLDFGFFKHPVYPCGLKENMTVRHELHSPEKVILCTEIPQQHTRFQTFLWNMMRFLTNHMPQA